MLPFTYNFDKFKLFKLRCILRAKLSLFFLGGGGGGDGLVCRSDKLVLSCIVASQKF
jgi:hypothetical protein